MLDSNLDAVDDFRATEWWVSLPFSLPFLIAYGADTKLFGDIVSKGFLPKTRAEYCEEEYEQIQDAVDLLIIPHIDLDLADELMDKPWLPESEQ